MNIKTGQMLSLMKAPVQADNKRRFKVYYSISLNIEKNIAEEII